MRGAVAWSYDLLDKEERAVLRRVAVFVGGGTLAAAEAVCVTGDEVAIEALGSLVEKSLVMHREQEDGEERFTMLEVVREYAIEQLEASGEANATRLSFARYFKHMTEDAELEIRRGNQVAWVRRLNREHDNLKAAIVHAQAPRTGRATCRAARPTRKATCAATTCAPASGSGSSTPSRRRASSATTRG